MVKLKRFVCLILTVLVLAGCSSGAPREDGALRRRLAQLRQEAQILQQQEEPPAETEPEGPLRFSQMEYVRPDLQELEALLNRVTELSQGGDVAAVMDAIEAFYDGYDWFYTHYCLADIHYSQDLTDGYWEEEYNFCINSSATVDAWLEEMYYTLAASPCREGLEGEEYFGEGFFDSYDGENKWDETFTAMTEREGQLENQYYALVGAATDYRVGTDYYYDAYAQDMAQVLVELILLRQEMARYWGYDTYAEFAWDFYYYRDYTPREMELYLYQVGQALAPVYRQAVYSNAWSGAGSYCALEDTYSFVRSAVQTMGGTLWEAFELMEERGLYDITYSENKYSTSFEVYLTGFEVPFLFVCPDRAAYDKLTLAHEFGHFANDYATGGEATGIDVLEIFSQAMEFMTLCYTPDSEQLLRIKMADSLATYVEQSCFASFEMAAYQLPEEQVTVENLCLLYEQTALRFGYDAVGYDRREFVTIPHFFTNPMYVVSYVVSNDAAMQIYQLEQEEAGRGLKRLTDTISTSEPYFLSFLKDADLESPFVPGRLQAVAQIFRDTLLN